MTDTTTTTTTTSTSSGKRPTHTAYHVREGRSGKGFWTQIGSAWTNRDGSFNIQLDVVPLDGRITLRVASDKKN